MLKNIQKYLLTHYPLVWNIRLLPMAIILVSLHLLLFLIGYLMADDPFGETYRYYYSVVNDSFNSYVTIFLVGVFILIGWLLSIRKYNGFSSFYPRKSIHLYAEWLMILLVCFMIGFLPISYTYGHIMRWKLAATEKECEESLNLLTKIVMFVPSDSYKYDYEFEKDKHLLIPLSDKDRKGLPENLSEDLYLFGYNTSANRWIPQGYKGRSLLYFSPNKYDYKRGDSIDISLIDELKEQLRRGEKEKIQTLLQEFIDLANKKGVKTSITSKEWIDRIYNPPYFPINDTTLIETTNSTYRYYEIVSIDGGNDQFALVYGNRDTVLVDSYNVVDNYYQKTLAPRVPFDELKRGYERVMDAHTTVHKDVSILTLLCACMAFMVAMLVFSSRVTGGKSWLKSFIIFGLLLFTITTLAVIFESTYYFDGFFEYVYPFFWVILFFILSIYLILKVHSKDKKGRSKYLLNIMLWLLPTVIPITYVTLIYHYSRHSHVYSYLNEDYIISVFWFNIIFITILMRLIVVFIRRWKGLPEE